ncbi:hypothetical protein DACRYDRAFT_71540, partial [Dacryopinax primogenitus]
MSGNLSHSMRENYETHGVEKYYHLVASSYRNPHFEGAQKCLHAWLDKWWLRESREMPQDKPASFWDLAAGSGEVTEAILNWYSLRRPKEHPSHLSEESHPPSSLTHRSVQRPVRRLALMLNSSIPDPLIIASDPYTAPAYTARTSRYCAPFSFADVAEGSMPSFTAHDLNSAMSKEPRSHHGEVSGVSASPQTVDMVVSSFALHLCTPSELFSLLYELSLKSKWLVVIAPHKKPEIKPGWGWVRWNISKWQEVKSDHESDVEVEIVLDRVRLRVWRS